MWQCDILQRVLRGKSAFSGLTLASASGKSMVFDIQLWLPEIPARHEHSPFSDEREALWELAQLNSANATVCENLLIRWFGTADTYERGNARDGQGFRAAIGLNVEYHRLATRSEAELGGRLAAALGNPRETDPYRVSATAKPWLPTLAARWRRWPIAWSPRLRPRSQGA